METVKLTRKNQYCSPIGFGWYTRTKLISIRKSQFLDQTDKKQTKYNLKT